jgi:hypothetical protein
MPQVTTGFSAYCCRITWRAYFQTYYCEYYARYLEEYEKYGAQLAARQSEEPIEISILMGDLVSEISPSPGLPDGILPHQKHQIWYTSEGLGMEVCGMFTAIRPFMTIWYILWDFDINLATLSVSRGRFIKPTYVATLLFRQL